MRFIVCAIFVCCLAAPPSLLAQKVKQLPVTRNSGFDPFSIKSGTTFSASSPNPIRSQAVATSSRERDAIVNELNEAENLIARNYVDSKKTGRPELTKSALDSLLHVLDPHSNYFDAAQWKELLDEQRSGYAGIGIALSTFERSGRPDTYVITTFDGTPARRANFQFGDRLVAVNGHLLEGESSDMVRDQIRGPIGTLARITLERATTGRLETIDVRRATVAQPSIPDSYLIRPGVGYIDLSEGFNYTTTDEFTLALKRLHQEGMSSLVLDLRGNRGGIVDQAVRVAEKFLPSGALIVSQQGRNRIDDREWRSADLAPETLPLVILVDENTASASEIVAGALQDNDRALIVGQKTFGKGLVQNVIDLPQKTGLTLTAARYYTPAGRSIQREYSDIGRYDYFSHRAGTSAIDKPHFEGRTITDRKVLGGDGITPDDAVSQTEMSSAQQHLLEAAFFFTRNLVNGRVAGLTPTSIGSLLDSSKGSVDKTLIGDDYLIRFEDFYSRNSFPPLLKEEIRRESGFIRLRIAHYLATASLGEVRARRTLTRDDPQVAAAINALPRSEKLYRQAQAIVGKRK